jgi:hypothetical protein
MAAFDLSFVFSNLYFAVFLGSYTFSLVLDKLHCERVLMLIPSQYTKCINAMRV